MNDDRKLRVGIIGVGNIGSAHARSIYEGKISGMCLCALCDTDAAVRQSLSEKYPNVTVFESSDALIESGTVEAVIIATPHYYHPPIAIKAFGHGLHVLTEKPAGVDLDSAKAMCEAAKKSGKTFGVMFNQRANKLFSEARRIVSSGELGELKRVVWIITNWYRKQCYYDSGTWRATWAGEGGGVLLNQAPHNLDLWQWICGMPTSVRAECSVAKYHHIEVEDEACIFAKYKNGATAVFITSTGDYPGTNRLEITGTMGKLVLEGGKLIHHKLAMDEREYRLSADNVKNPVQIFETLDEPYQGHAAILENFASAVLYGTPLLAPGEDALCELEISNAAYLSAWKNERISLPFDCDEFAAKLEKRKAASSFKSADKEHKLSDEYNARWNTNW
ncbi:MAG: Gfo/Idh/MocA family oxidoreductase [Clostridia bacterium]|nr:Gfo/Idh/MocA family oxidoreductase [Clostridia bacterium]